MKNNLKSNFIIHLCKYLGIGLISGSLVHAGTLGGSDIKYIFFVISGIILTVIGNIIEHKINNLAVNTKYIILTILLSFGTGMLGGSVQHYFDNVQYSSFLFCTGLVVTFLSFAYKDFLKEINIKSIISLITFSVGLYFVMTMVLPNFIPKQFFESGHHHESTNIENHHLEKSIAQPQSSSVEISTQENLSITHDSKKEHDHSSHKH